MRLCSNYIEPSSPSILAEQTCGYCLLNSTDRVSPHHSHVSRVCQVKLFGDHTYDIKQKKYRVSDQLKITFAEAKRVLERMVDEGSRFANLEKALGFGTVFLLCHPGSDAL